MGWRLAGLLAFELQESGGRGSAAGLALRAAHLRAGAPPQAPEAGARDRGQQRELFSKEVTFLSGFRGGTCLVTVPVFLLLP